MIYMIGPSGAGKTTIARELERRINAMSNHNRVQVIDGDVIRSEFGGIFGYTKEERFRCNQAVRVVLKYLLKNEISVVLTQVAAYEEMRQLVRKECGDAYVEVYVKCSYEELSRRDVKGYYALQKEGKMENLNGVNDIYEEPKYADIIINSEIQSVTEAVESIILFLNERRYDV